MPSRAWPATVPTIVAEAFRVVEDPLLPTLRPGGFASGADVGRALARSLAFEQARVEPPEWLLPHQVVSLRRVLASIARYHGALLADPVGSGKSFVALAAASSCNGTAPTACLVPANLRQQWEEIARRVGVPVFTHSHERLSRGSLPPEAGHLVVIDESHHFRNPTTRRYSHLAPWLVGRRALLLTATPVVNRLEDLAHQLRLIVRDDALRVHGVPSFTSILLSGRSHAALGHLVVAAGATDRMRRPGRTLCTIRAPADLPAELLQALEALALAAEPGIASLLRKLLWRAAASSPAALHGALRRYRSLLLQARDARASGRTLTRAALQRWIGAVPEQLLFWELLDPERAPEGTILLALEDLTPLESLIAQVELLQYRTDSKSRCLERILADGKSTLVFTSWRDTVRYLRDRLPGSPIAWCTGDRCGVGPVRLPRPAVLQAFGGGEPGTQFGAPRPTTLLTTDVTAEGLNLQRAERVVHYDLPWTEVRLAQREGRARRLGSDHQVVQVVRFEPAPELEARLSLLGNLSRKGLLPSLAGLVEGNSTWWAWRDEIARTLGMGAEAEGGVAAVDDPQRGVLAGFRMETASGQGGAPIRIVGWLPDRGEWCESPAVVTERLFRALEAGSRHGTISFEELDRILAALRPYLRLWIRTVLDDRWERIRLPPVARQLIRRFQGLATRAARHRDRGSLADLDRAIRFAGGGHTAGEAMLIGRLVGLADHELSRAVPGLPEPSPEAGPPVPRLTGLIVFRPAAQSCEGVGPTGRE